MLKVALALLVPLIATEAWSQGRPVSTTVTCSRVANLAASRGVVVLGVGVYSCNHYVGSQTFRVLGETTELAWVSTALIIHSAKSVISAVKGFSVKVAVDHRASSLHGLHSDLMRALT